MNWIWNVQGKEESGITLKNWVSATGRMKFPFAEMAKTGEVRNMHFLRVY